MDTKTRSTSLDPASRRSLHRFGITATLIFLWGQVNGFAWLAGGLFAAMITAATASAICAAGLRDPLFKGALNRWDETLAFLAMACLGALFV